MKDQADPWIGDLREWHFVDLYPPVVTESYDYTPAEGSDDFWSEWTWE